MESRGNEFFNLGKARVYFFFLLEVFHFKWDNKKKRGFDGLFDLNVYIIFNINK